MNIVRALVLAMACCLPAVVVAAAVPTPAQVRAAWRPSDAQLLDRDGVPLQSLRIDMAARRQPWVALADISPGLGRAVLQAEDQRFMAHGGIDFKAAGQAAWDNLFRAQGSRQAHPRGASTITMQLAGLLDAGAGGAQRGTQLAPEMGRRRSPRANWRPAGASSRSWKPT